MAYTELDPLNQPSQPPSGDEEALKRSNLYQSNQRLRIENISSQSDVHGGGASQVTKDSTPPTESPNVQLPESDVSRSENVVATEAIPLANPMIPDGINEKLQPIIERGTVQAPDTIVPGRMIRSSDQAVNEINVKAIDFEAERKVVFDQPPPPKEESVVQIKEEIVEVDIFESPKISIFGETELTTQEGEAFGLSLTYTFSSKVPVNDIEAVLRGVPDDFVIGKLTNSTMVPMTREADGSYRIAINDLPDISIIPPDGYSGETTFETFITGITQDGLVLISPSLSMLAKVDATADLPQITTTNISGNEDTSMGLSMQFSATSPDAIGASAYGSEVITAILKGVPGNINAYYEGSPGTYLDRDINGNWIVDPAKLTLVRFDTPDNYKGQFRVTLEATATEPSNGDSKTLSREFDVIVNPIADGIGSNIITSLIGNENTTITSPNGDRAIELILTDPSETIHVMLDNIPAGATIRGFDGTTYEQANGSAPVDITSWGRIITEGNVTKWVLDQLLVTTNNNSDADLTVQISAFTTDSGVGQTVTSSITNLVVPVTVLAVAQPADITIINNVTMNGNGSWTYAISEDQGASKTMAFNLALTDTDGSESLLASISDIPLGVIVQQVDMNGNVITSNSGTTPSMFLDTSMGTTIYLKVIPPLNSSDDFVLNLNIQTRENNPDNNQVAVRVNDQVIPINVEVTAVADQPDLAVVIDNNENQNNFSASIPEKIPNQTYVGKTFSFTANSTDLIDSTEPNGGPEVISGISMTGLAAGTVIESSYISGGSYTATSTLDRIEFIIPAGLTSVSGTYKIIPPTNFEGTINAVMTITSTEPTNGNTATKAITQTLTIDPVATVPTVVPTATYAINEDPATDSPFQTITFNTNDTTTDSLEVTLSGLEPGSEIISVASPVTTLIVDANGTVSLTSQNWPDLYDTTPGNLKTSGTIEFRIVPPENYSTTTPQTVIVTSIATDGTSIATSTSTFDFIVSPDADPLNNPSINATNIEEPSAGSLVTITLPLSDTDGSESITSAILQNIPDGYQVSVKDVNGIFQTVTLTSTGNGFNNADLLDSGDVIGNIIEVRIVPTDQATGTISMNVVVTNSDQGVTTDTNITDIPFSFVIDQSLDGATEVPTSATGSEDTNIPINLGLTFNDPTETFSQLIITANPAGGKFVVKNGQIETEAIGGDLLAAGWTKTSQVLFQPAQDSNIDTTATVRYKVVEPNGIDGPIESNEFTKEIPVTVLGIADAPSLTTNSIEFFGGQPLQISSNFVQGEAFPDGSESFRFVIAVTGPIIENTTSGIDWSLQINGQDLAGGTTGGNGDGTLTMVYYIDSLAEFNNIFLNPGATFGSFTIDLSVTVTENDYNGITNPGGQAEFNLSYTANVVDESQQMSMSFASEPSLSETVLLDINQHVTSINDTDFVTISGFSSNTDFYSADLDGNQSLIGQTDSNGSITLTGSQINGLDGNELYYDNLGGTNTFEMIVQVNDGITQETFPFSVDQQTGEMTPISNDFAMMSYSADMTTFDMGSDSSQTTDTSYQDNSTPGEASYTEAPSVMDQTSTTLDHQQQY